MHFLYCGALLPGLTVPVQPLKQLVLSEDLNLAHVVTFS